METYELEHIAKVRALSPECMVLLKTDGSFPMEAPGKIALYGNAARKTIKGGTGSGDVNVRHYVSVEEGLVNAGFTITTKAWLDAYDVLWAEKNKEFRACVKAKIAEKGFFAVTMCIGAIMPEPEYELPLDGEGDTAVYVLGRISGEGNDRAAEKGNLEMTDTEIRDILRLQKQYKRFLLVLNVGGVVDLSPVVNEVSNILLLSQLGSAIGDAFADVLLGKAYPSGKLASTWAKWEDYCHVGDFGDPYDTHYREGIYVGYRYFDSVDKKPLFPFGYGLGYTSLEIAARSVILDEGKVSVIAKVTNTGNYPGKEVVQLYVSIPEGKLDQPYQVLAGFTKTEELKPGESQEVTISFNMEDIASFDEETCNAILEKGSYVLHIGNSGRDTSVCAVVELDDHAVVQKLHDVGGKPDFTDWKPEKKRIATIPEGTIVLKLSASAIHEVFPAQPVTDPRAVELAKTMSDSDLALFCTGAFVGGNGSNGVIGNAGITVAGAAGETTGVFAAEGIPALIMADGPAGVRLSPAYGKDEAGVYSLEGGMISELADMIPEEMLKLLEFEEEKPRRNGTIHEQYCTAIPIGTALAQSWNIETCGQCGDIVAAEMERFGVHIWLAPALNIHRFPLCGRNFEYYSEDPLVSGKMAAALTKGVQKYHRGVSVKHFCCNNQETNRLHSNSMVSQRALRDIYLKGFRIVVDEAEPATIMSSYNLLNGEHTSQRYDLLETLLRQEWGYKGIVMSDWVDEGIYNPNDKYPGAVANGAIKAGNDIMMPGKDWHHKVLLNALDNPDAAYPITRENLEKCAARMIELAWRLGSQG